MSFVCLVWDERDANSYRNHGCWVTSWLAAWFVLVALVRFGMEQASRPGNIRYGTGFEAGQYFVYSVYMCE